MSVEVTFLISVLSLALAVYTGLKNVKRNDTSDIERRATEQAILNTKLDNISGDCREIKSEMGSVKREVQNLTERIVVVEQSVKSAHKRLDGITSGREHAE